MRTLARLVALATIVSLGTACASFPPPTARLSDAEAAVRGAQEVDANAVPRAALHVRLAQEQIDKALGTITHNMERQVRRGVVGEDEMDAAQEIWPRAEEFGVHDLIDPADTRPVLCEWLDEIEGTLAAHLGPARYTVRP